ncbi:hypothetical protein GQ53DRAFT_747521 [Thozetella sp. PMI_491]|nr:hypothetical protein GQ53DRAFT_747521 [Thozetella sp. PMI_491]
MRSHPYTPPPPLPPILDELAEEIGAILPNQSPSRRASDADVELRELDPDTSRLLPAKRKRHTVRVQGKLVVVRSVSTMDLKNTAGPGYESAVGSTISPRRPRRRRSLDGVGSGGATDSETEEEERETVVRDRQLRGYGIGGAGNIRRPTEVVHFPARRPGIFSPTSPTSGSDSDKRRWNIREFFGLAGDRKGKAKASP